MADVMARIDSECRDALKEVCARHPLKPTLKAAIERAVYLMIEDMEVEIENANK